MSWSLPNATQGYQRRPSDRRALEQAQFFSAEMRQETRETGGGHAGWRRPDETESRSTLGWRRPDGTESRSTWGWRRPDETENRSQQADSAPLFGSYNPYWRRETPAAETSLRDRPQFEPNQFQNSYQPRGYGNDVTEPVRPNDDVAAETAPTYAGDNLAAETAPTYPKDSPAEAAAVPAAPEKWFEKMIPKEYAHLQTHEEVWAVIQDLGANGKMTKELARGFDALTEKLNYEAMQALPKSYEHLTSVEEVDAAMDSLDAEGKLTPELYSEFMNLRNKVESQNLPEHLQKQDVWMTRDVLHQVKSRLNFDDANGNPVEIPPPAASSENPGQAAGSLLNLYESYAAIAPEERGAHFLNENLHNYFKAAMYHMVPFAEAAETSGEMADDKIASIMSSAEEARAILAGAPDPDRLQDVLDAIEVNFPRKHLTFLA